MTTEELRKQFEKETGLSVLGNHGLFHDWLVEQLIAADQREREAFEAGSEGSTLDYWFPKYKSFEDYKNSKP